MDTTEPSSKRARLDEEESEEARMQRVVLVACGSMSPITNMHLRLFELARDHMRQTGRYCVEEGIISLVHDSYGKKGLASSTHRKAMVELALQGNDWIKLDPWECDQSEWLPTRQVLEYIQEVVSARSEGRDRIRLLCGADLLETFATPGLWSDEDIEKIVGDFGLVVISRFGHNAAEFVYKSDQLFPHKNKIELVTEWIPNDISSTKIRRSLQRGESVKYLVPDPVIGYIKQHNLYTESDSPPPSTKPE